MMLLVCYKPKPFVQCNKLGKKGTISVDKKGKSCNCNVAFKNRKRHHRWYSLTATWIVSEKGQFPLKMKRKCRCLTFFPEKRLSFCFEKKQTFYFHVCSFVANPDSSLRNQKKKRFCEEQKEHNELGLGVSLLKRKAKSTNNKVVTSNYLEVCYWTQTDLFCFQLLKTNSKKPLCETKRQECFISWLVWKHTRVLHAKSCWKFFFRKKETGKFFLGITLRCLMTCC